MEMFHGKGQYSAAISTNKDSRAGFNGAQILLHTYWRHMQSASMVDLLQDTNIFLPCQLNNEYLNMYF